MSRTMAESRVPQEGTGGARHTGCCYLVDGYDNGIWVVQNKKKLLLKIRFLCDMFYLFTSTSKYIGFLLNCTSAHKLPRCTCEMFCWIFWKLEENKLWREHMHPGAELNFHMKMAIIATFGTPMQWRDFIESGLMVPNEPGLIVVVPLWRIWLLGRDH
jgi:hypothetical protein